MPSSHCLRSKHIARVCDACGKYPLERLHILLRGPGFYCDRAGCCPACNPTTEASKTNSFERPRGLGLSPPFPQAARRGRLSRLDNGHAGTILTERTENVCLEKRS